MPGQCSLARQCIIIQLFSSSAPPSPDDAFALMLQLSSVQRLASSPICLSQPPTEVMIYQSGARTYELRPEERVPGDLIIASIVDHLHAVLS